MHNLNGNDRQTGRTTLVQCYKDVALLACLCICHMGLDGSVPVVQCSAFDIKVTSLILVHSRLTW